MPLPGCKLTYLVEPPTAFIRIAGRAAVEGAREFKGLIERLHGEGIPQFCLDLSECLLMDSTFSGVLAGLATRLGDKTPDGSSRFVLVKPNERIRDLLDSLGVLALVTVIESQGGSRHGETEVAMGGSSKQLVAECCLEAHRLLMALNTANVSKFRELTKALENQLQAPPAP
jgi:anti-anti-sigma regulatory factor